MSGEDMQANLVSLHEGRSVSEHVNDEVDVLYVWLRGQGTLLLDGQKSAVQAGSFVYVSRGTARAIEAGAEGLLYVTCHRKRRLLQPTLLRGSSRD